MATDQGLVPDPEAIAAGFQAEIDALLALQRQGAPASFAAMNARLDEAMQALEAMLRPEDDPEGGRSFKPSGPGAP